MIDGLRPDAFDQARLTHLQALKNRGAATLRARSVMPSVTLPCHLSIFHSIPPSRHGILTNDWQPMVESIPGLIDQAKMAGRRCYSFHNWEPLRNLNRPESLHFSYYRDNCYTEEGDDLIAAVAAQTITAELPDFAFVYLGTVDVAGHAYGWMSDRYLRQAERVDQAIGALIEQLPAGSTILVQSDHGGHDQTHGTDLPEDMLIPWLITGPDIRQGHEIQADVSLLDTAPTLARLLDIPPHASWEGRTVDEIFIANTTGN